MNEITSETQPGLFKALKDRGIYNPNNVFHNFDGVELEPEDSKYKYKISVYKWNTSSSKLVIVGARLDKSGKWVISTYRQGSTKMIKHGGV